MKRRYWQITGLIFLLLIVGGCQSDAGEDELEGRIALWHSWSPEEARVLQEALTQFEEIHPNVKIITVAIPEDQILEEFYQVGNDGLGPGLMIGNDSWISDLADSGLIRPFSHDQITTSFFNSRNRNLVQYQDKIYGVPMSLAPYALYYNKSMVTNPPVTLDDLLTEARAGNTVAFVPRFEEAYWGIQTFGNGLFDAVGHFTLAESGFTEWLHWLNNAQAEPGIILNVDDESLLDLFASGQIAYYVAGPDKQQRINALIDEENPFEIGVVPLPQGPMGASGPLLNVETLLFYTHASENQAEIANDLALFLVTQQQSIRFLRELDQIPANPTVRVDNRIYPVSNGFSRQARTAVVLPNEIPIDPFVEAGNLAYNTVLSGLASPEEAVCQFGLRVAELMAYTDDEMDLPENCPPPVK
ncbi:MAG: extracellular solute-binding protein [Anaerolineae bacterium]|nr:extracellular solute-binding protein [Anaerolineae bacterium]